MVWTVIRLILLMFLLATGAEAAQRRSEPADPSGAGRVFRDCPACPEMVVVPAGEFMMGSPESEKGRGKDEAPQRKVTFAQPFAVGKFEVTFAQWDACTTEGGCTYTSYFAGAGGGVGIGGGATKCRGCTGGGWWRSRPRLRSFEKMIRFKKCMPPRTSSTKPCFELRISISSPPDL